MQSLLLPNVYRLAGVVTLLAFASAAAVAAPKHAIAVNNIQSAYQWQMTQDSATGSGTATGTMNLVSSPSLSGAAREFGITFQYSAGERYWSVFGADTSASNFTYDARVYIPSSSDIANLEFDMNQVMANGETVIFGVQCDGYSDTWDYTTNAGTPQNPSDQWLHSTAPCNPQKWAANTWHHVQMNYSRDSQGNVTYKTVTLDGVQQSINETVPSAFALNWGPVLLTNFQIDGIGAYGSATVYLDKLTITRW